MFGSVAVRPGGSSSLATALTTALLREIGALLCAVLAATTVLVLILVGAM